MKIISHRGNIRGAIPDHENRPSYIDCAMGSGYDVEIDLRVVDGELWLGHDEPQYKIEHSWLEPRKEFLWIHCKDLKQQSSVGVTNPSVIMETLIHILQQVKYGYMKLI